MFAVVCIALLAPTLILIAVWAGYLRWRRPNWTIMLVPILLYGAVIGFQTYTYVTGGTFGFLRFYITAIPFAATMALLAVPDGAFLTPKRRAGMRRRRRSNRAPGRLGSPTSPSR